MEKSGKKTLLLTICGVFAVILCMQCNASYVSDDFAIKLALHTPLDILRKPLATYFSWDGRITAYISNSVLLFINPHAAALILTANLTAAVFLTVIIALGPDWRNSLRAKHFVLGAALFWLSMPAFGETFIWRTGSCYGVTTTLALVILHSFSGLVHGQRLPAKSLFRLIPATLYCGLGDYNTTAVLALATAACCVYHEHRYRRKERRFLIIPLLFAACFIVVYLAPGNHERMLSAGLANSTLENILAHLKSQFRVQGLYVTQYIVLGVALLSLFPALRAGKVEAPGDKPKIAGPVSLWDFLATPRAFLTVLFFLMAQAAQAAFMFAPWADERAYTSSAVFFLLAALSLFFCCGTLPGARQGAASWLRSLVWAGAPLLCLLSLLPTAYMYMEQARFHEQCEAAIAAAPAGADLCLPPGPYRSTQYFYSGRSRQIGDDPAYWMNTAYAAYYGLASVRLCPQNFSIDSGPGTGGAFQGTVRDSVLRFIYTPSPENAARPFILVFPKPPRNPLRAFAESRIIPVCDGFEPVRRYIANNYLHVSPHSIASGSTISGEADMPHLEHANGGYILHYGESGKKDIRLVPLTIGREAPL